MDANDAGRNDAGKPGSKPDRLRPPGPARRTGERAAREGRGLSASVSPRQLPSVSLTAAASCLSENGLGRKAKVSSSSRFFLKASSA